MIYVLAAVLVVVLLLVRRRRRKAVLAGLSSAKPVFSVDPPRRTLSPRRKEGL